MDIISAPLDTPSGPLAGLFFSGCGINKTDWVKIDRATYDQCLDPRDYRPKPSN